ncbi:MAG: MlaE family ABC transporter permease [Candidatus Xenobia bacterium]
MMAFLEDVGLYLIAFFEFVGGVVNLFFETLGWIGRGAVRAGLTLHQMALLGINSLPIALLTVGFTGAVMSLELASQAVKFGFTRFVGAGVALSMGRELGPMITAVIFAGRAGSAITAEIGSMKVTEQLDALFAMATSPVKYLVVPRFLACITMVPLLTVFGNVAGIGGGALVASATANVPWKVYMDSIQQNVVMWDFMGGLEKALIFGGEIALIACFQGLTTRGGAAGVGQSTTASVVSSIITVFVTNYFLSMWLFPSWAH